MFTPSPEMQRIIQDDLPEDVKPIVEKAVTESENIATRLIQDFEQQLEQKLEAYERRTEEAVKTLTSALDNLVDEAEKNADAMKEHHDAITASLKTLKEQQAVLETQLQAVAAMDLQSLSDATDALHMTIREQRDKLRLIGRTVGAIPATLAKNALGGLF